LGVRDIGMLCMRDIISHDVESDRFRVKALSVN